MRVLYFDGKKSFRLLDDRRDYADSTYYDVRIEAVKDTWILAVSYYEPLEMKVDTVQIIDAEQIRKWTIGSQSRGISFLTFC